MTTSWPASFVAVGVVLGEPLDALVDALRDGRDGRDAAEEVLVALRSPDRRTRAVCLARAVSDVAVAIEQTRVRA